MRMRLLLAASVQRVRVVPLGPVEVPIADVGPDVLQHGQRTALGFLLGSLRDFNSLISRVRSWLLVAVALRRSLVRVVVHEPPRQPR